MCGVEDGGRVPLGEDEPVIAGVPGLVVVIPEVARHVMLIKLNSNSPLITYCHLTKVFGLEVGHHLPHDVEVQDGDDIGHGRARSGMATSSLCG